MDVPPVRVDSEEVYLSVFDCISKDCRNIFKTCDCDSNSDLSELNDFELPKTSYVMKGKLGLNYPDPKFNEISCHANFDRTFDLFVSKEFFLLPRESMIMFLDGDLFGWAEELLHRNEHYFAFANSNCILQYDEHLVKFRTSYVTLVQIMKTHYSLGNNMACIYVQAVSRLKVEPITKYGQVFSEDHVRLFTDLNMSHDALNSHNTLVQDKSSAWDNITCSPFLLTSSKYEILKKKILSFYKYYPKKHCLNMGIERTILFIIRNYKFTVGDKIEAFRYNYSLDVLCSLWKKMRRSDIVCSSCESNIGHTDNILCFEKGCSAASLIHFYDYYINPSMTTIEMLILRELTSFKRDVNDWSSECSWFDNYLWKALLCEFCSSFIGFEFLLSEGSVNLPRNFFGLRKSSIKIA